MSTETIEIFNNSDEWANQLKHLLSKGENLALLHGLTPDILDRIYAYAFDYHEKGNCNLVCKGHMLVDVSITLLTIV
ncbi:hypothetical protein ACUOA8_44650, partial [Escherichia sp. SS-MK2]